MPRRPPRRKPVTAEEIETFLDFVAGLMDRNARRAKLLLPIWQALERERANLQEADACLAAARERLTRSRDRTATPA